MKRKRNSVGLNYKKCTPLYQNQQKYQAICVPHLSTVDAAHYISQVVTVNCGILLLPVTGHTFLSKSFVQSSSSRYEEHKPALHVKVPPPKSPKTPTSQTIPVFPNSPTINGQSSASQPKSPRSPGFQAVPNLNHVQIDLSPYPW